MYYTYVLQSDKDGNFYVGYTADLKQSFEQHEKGLVDSTRERMPLRLIYYKACMHMQDATKQEKHLKTHYGRMFLQKRPKSYFTG